MTFRRLLQSYRDWLTQPIDPLPLGIFRSWFGFICLVNFLLLYPDITMWFSEAGVITNESAIKMMPGFRANIFAIFPSITNLEILVYYVGAIGAVGLIFGLFSRSSAFLVWITTHSFAIRNPDILHSGDTLIRLGAFFLIFSQCGAAWSFDRLIEVFFEQGKNMGHHKIDPWPQRILQFQLCVVYGSTALAKSLGQPWLSGSAVGTVLQLTELQRFWLPDFFYSASMSAIMTWVTLIFEGSFPLLVWFLDTRLIILGIGVLFHLGLEYSLNVQLFQWIITSYYLLFLKSSELHRVGTSAQQIFADKISRLVVIYDGQCGVCKQVIKLLVNVDILRRIQFFPSQDASLEAQFPTLPIEQATNAILACDSRNEWQSGWSACKLIARKIPLFWIAIPFFYIPGVNHLGDWLYRSVAANRQTISKYLGFDACEV